MSTTAEVFLWGTRIGILSLPDRQRTASFEYDRNFLRSRIEVSPLRMPLSERVYSFPGLSEEAFHGVPGLVSDSLPDRFGNAVIDQWLAGQGRAPGSFNVVERLCYTGSRGMGALEYVPADGPESENGSVDVDTLVSFASEVLKKREKLHITKANEATMGQLLQMGTSAGGARAKAIIAWNEETNDIRSGQVTAGDGYGYWLMKFDGVEKNGDHGIEDAPQFTRIEYAYYLMAVDAGLVMSDCRLFEENGRAHFMTRRFDREKSTGRKLHMQTLGALSHIDYNTPGLCSYEQAAGYARMIGLTAEEIEQFYRRMVFHVLAVNQDDHVKNTSFLMDRNGGWHLAPAYDETFAYDETNRWLSAHQMTICGKTFDITEKDMILCGERMDLRRAKCVRMIAEVTESVKKWTSFAEYAGVNEASAKFVEEKIFSALQNAKKEV